MNIEQKTQTMNVIRQANDYLATHPKTEVYNSERENITSNLYRLQQLGVETDKQATEKLFAHDTHPREKSTIEVLLLQLYREIA